MIVTARLKSMVTESERVRQELQMPYGIHVYARAKLVPDLILSRGEEAKLAGDQSIEFMAAGGLALAHLELGEVDEAARWLVRRMSVGAGSTSSRRS